MSEAAILKGEEEPELAGAFGERMPGVGRLLAGAQGVKGNRNVIQQRIHVQIGQILVAIVDPRKKSHES